VLVPGVILAAVTSTVSFGPWGDQATIQLATDRAARFGQLLGPYSRFGWSHPGPLYFYLLALPYKVFGNDVRGMALASVVLSVVAAALVVVTVGSLAGRHAARWAAAVVVAELAALGAGWWALVWNPVAIIVPTTLFLVGAAGLAGGRWWSLVVVVGAGSFLVETDVGTALFVAAVGLVALLAAVMATARGRAGSGSSSAWRSTGWWPDGWRGTRPAPARHGRRPVAVPVAAAVVLGAVLWLAPAYQQLTDHPGNLSRVVRFFRSPPPHSGHSLTRAVVAVAGALWPPLRGRLSGPPPAAWEAWLMVAGTLVAALLVAGAGRLAGMPLAASLGAVGAVGVVAGVASATRVTGPLFSYLVEWLSAVTVAVVLGALLLVRLPALPVLAAAVSAVALGVGAVLVPPSASREGTQVAALWRRLAPALPRGAPVRVDVASASRWPWAAGLLVELTHHGHAASAQSRWLFIFGAQFTPAGAPPPAATVTVWTPGAGAAPPGRQVAVVHGTAVYLS
jgi:hypothetical protein